MLNKLLFLFGLLFTQSLFAQTRLELKDFLKDFYNFSALPAYLSQTYSAQESSYDRRGLNDDGFGGAYSFLRRNPDSTLVIFEVKGTGVVNRIWTPTPTEDTLDFYIDTELKPTFSIKYRDLYTGKVFPFVPPLCANQLGGFYCYLPIPFNQSCKIVLRGKKAFFHQIGYRLYPAGTSVKPFALPLSVDEKAVLEKIKTLWNKSTPTALDYYQVPISTSKKQVTLQPKQSLLVYESAKAGRLAGFEILSASELGLMARDIDLRVTYDDEKTPAIYCSLADYFGYGFEQAAMKGLMVGSDGKWHYSWFPMPFDKSLKIELLYRQPAIAPEISGVTLLVKTHFIDKKRDQAKEGKFYAIWNRENPVPKGKPYTFLDIKGKGHLVGATLQSQGLLTGITNFFEGDDSTVVDGKMRFHGTGSEDFFNGGWYALLDCWDDGMSLPLSGALDYSIPLCRTGGYRYFLTDKVTFEQSLLHTIEHGPEFNLVPSDYSSVTYYYSDRPNLQKLIPSASNTRVPVNDTMEVYPQLIFSAIDNYSEVKARWTGSPGKTLYYTIASNTILKMSLAEIPPGEYQVFMDYEKGADAAEFSLWQRQSQLTEWINAKAPGLEKVRKQLMCNLRLTEQNNGLTFRFKADSSNTKFTLNRIVLVRVKS